LHPTKAKRRGGQHEPPASAGRLVPSSPLARRGGRAAGQNALQQTPDENQQIRHLTAADMVGVELPNTFLLEKPPGAPRHRNHSRRRRHPKLNYIHARPPGPVDLLNRTSRFGAPAIVSESRQTANRFISAPAVSGISGSRIREISGLGGSRGGSDLGILANSATNEVRSESVETGVI
jgi:hypothetical protein